MRPSWDEFCVVCGGPPSADPQLCSPVGLNTISPIGTDWLDDWVGVTPEQPDEPISIGYYNGHGCFEQCQSRKQRRRSDVGCTALRFATFGQWSCYIAPYEREHAPQRGLHWLVNWWPGLNMAYRDGDWALYGVAFHRACGEVLQQQLGYAVNFDDIWPLLRQQDGRLMASSNHLQGRSYGGTERYHGEHRFLYADVSPGDEYLLLDPLSCSGNADRIVAVWEPLLRKFVCKQRRSKQAGSSRTSAMIAATHAIGRSRKQVHVGTSTSNETCMSGSTVRGGAAPNSSRNAGCSTARVTRSAAASKLKDLRHPASNLLQLAVSHASTQQQQLQLTAQLLPLCSSMPQWLAGTLRLPVGMKANTGSRVTEVSSWLQKNGCVLSSLDVEAVVDCCPKDAHKATTTLATCIAAAAAANQALKLTRYKGHVAGTEDAEDLLQTLPLQHLTSLHLTGPWELTEEGAAALSIATGLQDLCLPGAGRPDALTAAGLGALVVVPPPASLAAVLSVTLQRLNLTDAGCVSAEELTAVGQQLAALTGLELSYHPSEADDDETAALLTDPDNSDNTIIAPAVLQAWSDLSALCSLQLGSRKVAQEASAFWRGEWDVPAPEHPAYISIDSQVLDSIAGLTGLTSLDLGSSAALQALGMGDSGVQLLQLAVEHLPNLQELGLTLQIDTNPGDHADPYMPNKREQLMRAVGQLPALQSLALSVSLYLLSEVNIQSLLYLLDDATELTHLEVVHGGKVYLGYEKDLKQFSKKYPEVTVVCPEGVENLRNHLTLPGQ